MFLGRTESFPFMEVIFKLCRDWLNRQRSKISLLSCLQVWIIHNRKNYRLHSSLLHLNWFQPSKECEYFLRKAFQGYPLERLRVLSRLQSLVQMDAYSKSWYKDTSQFKCYMQSNSMSLTSCLLTLREKLFLIRTIAGTLFRHDTISLVSPSHPTFLAISYAPRRATPRGRIPYSGVPLWEIERWNNPEINNGIPLAHDVSWINKRATNSYLLTFCKRWHECVSCCTAPTASSENGNFVFVPTKWVYVHLNPLQNCDEIF